MLLVAGGEAFFSAISKRLTRRPESIYAMRSMRVRVDMSYVKRMQIL